MGENEDGAGRYHIDPSRSQFIVRAFATGLLSAFAHNPTIAIRDFAGEVHFNPEALEEASLKLQINATSLQVVDNVSDKDRAEMERQMREEVLLTEHHPEILFGSTSVAAEKIFEGQYRAKINGKLTLRGITRDIEIKAQVIASSDTLRANGEFPMLQSDFNIKPVSAVGGTIKLKDELKFSFDVVAHR
jgi:polyisoprenoid-binding protein YceI